MKYLISFIIIFSTIFAYSQEYSLNFTMNNPDGIFKSGEKIVFSAQILKDGKPLDDNCTLRYVLRHNGKDIAVKDAPASTKSSIETAMQQAGWCSVIIMGLDEKKQLLKGYSKGKQTQAHFDAGAIVEPLSIKQGAETPKDFNAFWEKEIAKLKELKMQANCRPYPNGDPKHNFFLTVNMPEGIRPVEGILNISHADKPKSLPIWIHVHGAGVHNPSSNLKWTCARHPAIFLNLNAHGIPNDKSKEFYENLRNGELKNYPFINSNSREKYYMRGMVLRLARALQYLKTRPEWDGKNIYIGGASQGGAQALILGGLLANDVTEIYADVPAMCDLGASLANRSAGWPKLYLKKSDGTFSMATDYDRKNDLPSNKSIVDTAGYYDAVNFAKNIKCRVTLRAGGGDGVCPPSSVFAAYNNVPSKDKSIIFSPRGCHCSGVWKDLPEVKMAIFENQNKK